VGGTGSSRGGGGVLALGGNAANGEVGGYGVLAEGWNGSVYDGVGGSFAGGTASALGDGVDAYAGSGYAGNFTGNVNVTGNLSKSGGNFKIDDPLDPANKYLYHSFVESPDMMNIYNGVATLDAEGATVITMPEWFSILNRDFRYQLTCIGGFAPVYIAEELANNQFKIGGGHPGMRISWQITGIRQDPWANAHRIPVEEEKEPNLRGYYIHPEPYGAPREKQIEWARHPDMMKKMRDMKSRQIPRPVQSKQSDAKGLVPVPAVAAARSPR
jgi:trimeric autotransporter adhesin